MMIGSAGSAAKHVSKHWTPIRKASRQISWEVGRFSSTKRTLSPGECVKLTQPLHPLTPEALRQLAQTGSELGKQALERYMKLDASSQSQLGYIARLPVYAKPEGPEVVPGVTAYHHRIFLSATTERTSHEMPFDPVSQECVGDPIWNPNEELDWFCKNTETALVLINLMAELAAPNTAAKAVTAWVQWTTSELHIDKGAELPKGSCLVQAPDQRRDLVTGVWHYPGSEVPVEFSMGDGGQVGTALLGANTTCEVRVSERVPPSSQGRVVTRASLSMGAEEAIVMQF